MTRTINCRYCSRLVSDDAVPWITNDAAWATLAAAHAPDCLWVATRGHRINHELIEQYEASRPFDVHVTVAAGNTEGVRYINETLPAELQRQSARHQFNAVFTVRAIPRGGRTRFGNIPFSFDDPFELKRFEGERTQDRRDWQTAYNVVYDALAAIQVEWVDVTAG